MKCKGEGFKFCCDLKRMQKQSGSTSPSEAGFVESGGYIRRNSRLMAVIQCAINTAVHASSVPAVQGSLVNTLVTRWTRSNAFPSREPQPHRLRKADPFAFSLKSIQPFGRSVLRLRIDEVKGLASFITLQKLADFLRHGRFLESNLTSRTFRTFLAICFNGMIALISRAFVGQTTV